MKITLTDSGKRFNRDWIFRHLSYEFFTGISYAITGPNGSGKSTLLQLIAGSMAASEGKIDYRLSTGANILPSGPESVYKYMSLTAPYLEVVEEMTFRELLHFHQHFKPFLPAVSIEGIIAIAGLEKAADKQIRFYSSGMKQRVKLVQALFSDTPVLLLDEPCNNLDSDGIILYLRLVQEYCSSRLVIVSSNDEQEYVFCSQKIKPADFR